jgi:uncharacterized protein (DUF2267 family)
MWSAMLRHQAHTGIALALLLAACLSTAEAAPTPPALPEQIPTEERARLMRVAEAASVSTHVDAEPFVSRAAVFEYLLDHPEFATHVTQALKLARYRIWHTPEGLYLDDGWGATGHFTVAYAARGKRVMYAWGQYKPRVLPSIRGQAVIMLEYGFQPTAQGLEVVSSTVTGFVKLDSRVLAFASKLASSLAQSKADSEARKLMKVFARVSQAVQDNPGGVYEQLRQRPETPARELEEFRQLLNVR